MTLAQLEAAESLKTACKQVESEKKDVNRLVLRTLEQAAEEVDRLLEEGRAQAAQLLDQARQEDAVLRGEAAEEIDEVRGRVLDEARARPNRCWSRRGGGRGPISLPTVGEVQVLVLAAGRGSRLGGLGGEVPKWLLDVGGRSIADRHLEALALAADAGCELRAQVVTGHASDALDRYLAGSGAITTTHNAQWATLNNWYSALVGLRAIEAADPTVVILNSDLFARSQWIADYLITVGRSSAEGLIAVDRSRRLTDESMKVSAEGDDATLATIGKVGIERPVGEYVGMLSARGPVLAAFRAALEHFETDPGFANEWYEAAVSQSAAAGTGWRIWPTPDGNWVEIDDEGDHVLATELSQRL